MRMAFTVAEFHDLVELLESHPEWRGELRRLLLSDDILDLPRVVRELAERVEEQLARLTEQMAALAEAERRTVGRLDQAIVDLAKLKGDALERRYRERAPSYFAKLLRRIRVLSSTEVADLADDAIERRVLSETDRGELLAADLVGRGLRREDQQEAYLVVEVSSLIDAHDVLRASERAALLAAITGKPAIAVVAGEQASLDAREAARDRQAWQVLDGVVQPPEPSSGST